MKNQGTVSKQGSQGTVSIFHGRSKSRKNRNGPLILGPMILPLICLLLLLGGCKPRTYHFAAPVNIPHTSMEMKTAGFWIAMINELDELILDEKGIRDFNVRVEKELHLITDPLTWPEQFNGKELHRSLIQELVTIVKQKLYTDDAKLAGEEFFAPVRENLNLTGIDDIRGVRYAFLVQYDDQRLLPTDKILTSEPRDVEFDELQNSSLDIGTPLLVLHESKDSAWVYAQTPTSSGWIKKENVAICDLVEFKELLAAKSFVVVTSPKADIFQDAALTQQYGYVRMGVIFRFSETAEKRVFEITIPTRSEDGRLRVQKAYMKRQDCHVGYLTYTQRNIIEQAFKMLNSPYGWGGKDGEQDCSSFLQEVFKTVGIILPRNSSAQGKTGIALAGFKEGLDIMQKKMIIAQEAVPGMTVFQMNGHIALFLGMHEQNAYIIHDTHGYGGQKSPFVDITWVVNRVIVSDLNLGIGSKKGSLLSRILNVRMIK